MKKILFLILGIFGLANVSFAQKFGYIDSGFILSKMPAYANAQREVDRLSENWQKEIEGMLAEIDKLEKNYRAEEVLLTPEMKTKRQKEITDKQAEVRDYQRKIFGFEGTLFKRRQELAIFLPRRGWPGSRCRTGFYRIFRALLCRIDIHLRRGRDFFLLAVSCSNNRTEKRC